MWEPQANYSIPTSPVVFFKNRNSLANPDDVVAIPPVSTLPDYEVLWNRILMEWNESRASWPARVAGAGDRVVVCARENARVARGCARGRARARKHARVVGRARASSPPSAALAVAAHCRSDRRRARRREGPAPTPGNRRRRA